VTKQSPLRRVDSGLLLILVLGTALRLQYVDLPFAEAHRWRFVTNLDVTRNFATRSMNIFWPQASWGGPAAYLGMEFPLLQWIAAVLYKVFGDHETLCRYVTIAFSVASIAVVFMLGKRMFGTAAGRAAAFLVAVSPSMVFFGRTFLSDIPMVFFMVAGLFGYVVYLETGSRGHAIAGAVCTALAGLVKLPAVAIIGPIAWAAWRARGWSALRDRWLTVGIAAGLVIVAAWYWHADRVFHMTGLTEAIFHSSDNPPPELMAFTNQSALQVIHWGNYALLAQWDYYDRMRDWTWHLHLTPVGFSLAVVGLVTMFRVAGYEVVVVWLAAVISTMLASAVGSFYHEFHQLPLVPPAAMLFGLVAAPAFDVDWLRRRFGGWWGVPIAAVLVTSLAWMAFIYSAVVRNYFRPESLDLSTMDVARVVQEHTAPPDYLITVEFGEYGNNSPVLLYRADRRGWSFDAKTISPHVIEYLHTRYHTRYLVTTVDIGSVNPDVSRYLRDKKAIDVGHGATLFQLE
jgi:4-amino-4-deoxy-L-arabinose transferase-like glycosyltransferase